MLFIVTSLICVLVLAGGSKYFHDRQRSLAHQRAKMEAETERHRGFMRQAIQQAEYALANDETPVGCVFVHNGKVIGRGINDTNKSMNGTRHAEFIALNEILTTHPLDILHQTDLYVTVEPCIMCAAALRQYGIRAVYYGCNNDRFGGTDGVLSIHNEYEAPYAPCATKFRADLLSPSIDPPYPALGGIYREEAIMLLRRFYVQENDKAPEPRTKKNRVLKENFPPPKGAVIEP